MSLLMREKYRCPRCKGEVVECLDVIICKKCQLEFNKEEILVFGEDVALSYHEKKEAVRELAGSKYLNDLLDGFKF